MVANKSHLLIILAYCDGSQQFQIITAGSHAYYIFTTILFLIQTQPKEKETI